MDLIENTDIDISDMTFRLPFPTMTIEFESAGDTYCVFAVDLPIDDKIVNMIFGKPGGKPNIGYLGSVVCTNESYAYALPFSADDKIALELTDKQVTELGTTCVSVVGVIQRLIIILDCDNAPVVTIEAPAKLNKKRAAQNKSLIPRYRTLHISDHRRMAHPDTHIPGTHASPRTHWRRGHIRRMMVKGNPITRWIKPTIVGGGTPANPKVEATGLEVRRARAN